MKEVEMIIQLVSFSRTPLTLTMLRDGTIKFRSAYAPPPRIPTSSRILAIDLIMRTLLMDWAMFF